MQKQWIQLPKDSVESKTYEYTDNLQYKYKSKSTTE